MLSFQVPNIPELEKFVKRFSFVNDPLLQLNLGICLQYVVFLLSIYEEEKITGTVKNSIAKDIVFYTASIIEALSHYWLQILVEEEGFDIDVLIPPSKEYKSIRTKHIFFDDNYERIFLCREVSKKNDVHGELKFVDILKALKRSEKIDEKLYRKLNKVRSARNKIHIRSLRESDKDIFTKGYIKESFDITKTLIQRIEKELL